LSVDTAVAMLGAGVPAFLQPQQGAGHARYAQFRNLYVERADYFLYAFLDLAQAQGQPPSVAGAFDDAIERAERGWAELIGEVEREYEAGTSPSDPRVQELASRWRALVEQFTGGDPGIRASLERMYREEGVERASHGMVKPELMEYVGRAMAAGGD
jgi:TipAS antibiotic-recognition domain